MTILADDKLINAMVRIEQNRNKEFMSNLLTYLIQNSNLKDEDAKWLNLMLKNAKKTDYLRGKKDYDSLERDFTQYKESKGNFYEKDYEELLINHLKDFFLRNEELNLSLKATVNKLSNLYNASSKKRIENVTQKVDALHKKMIGINNDMEHAENSVQKIHDNLTKSQEMLGDIAENSNAYRYIKYAKENKIAARWLFWFSVAIMGSLAIFSAFALYFTDITSKDLFVRISLFFAILLPAFFMMREAKKLKDKEFQYTDMAYRIVTSEPYIDGLNLSPEEKAKLKAALVKDFFGRSIECRDDGGLPPIDNICEIIKTCLESCKKD